MKRRACGYSTPTVWVGKPLGYMGAETTYQLQSYVIAARSVGQPAASLFGLFFHLFRCRASKGRPQPTDPVWNLDMPPILFLFGCVGIFYKQQKSKKQQEVAGTGGEEEKMKRSDCTQVSA
ncbi:hypothetical protein QBC44DRAFT_99533 [Cladorrhinum sp. PSN332]|nr:hypothetical protein QBC44DRAFT_99533 [Cladorrhinum sp. PSN332]